MLYSLFRTLLGLVIIKIPDIVILLIGRLSRIYLFDRITRAYGL